MGLNVTFRDFFIRDVSDAEYSFGGTLVFGFSDGPAYSEVEVGGGVRLPKDTGIRDARVAVIQNARRLLNLAIDVSETELAARILESQRDPVDDEESNTDA